ncbi:MAG: fumarylacetoacetate hydrolase family protein [Methylococcaceae bacterium]|jgi:2-keto-4-pentenoate hydratase/2-oxohepta-3-ene-1,7-dioic acid hydratase (catechol pathway)
MNYAFAPDPVVTLLAMSSNPYPVRRLYCTSRNYTGHEQDKAAAPDLEPFFFMKPASTIVQNNSVLPYPSKTSSLQAEVQLVVAISRGGTNIPADKVNYDYVFGYAVGLDMTRRDLQDSACGLGQPWEFAKGFDHSAPCSAITPEFYSGIVDKGKIELKVNGEVRQSADLSEMILKIPEMVNYLSTLFELRPGDLIYTGTPTGGSLVKPGDKLEATIAGLEPLIIGIG